MNKPIYADNKDATHALALWLSAKQTCEIRKDPLSRPEQDQVLIRTLFSGISRGTEALVFQGKVPHTETERMRGPHMAGDFCFPVKYGYCLVGVVEEGTQDLLGKAVFCLHPHQTACIINKDMVTILPDRVSPDRAILAANMETALNIVWDAHVQPGDRVAVFGAGVVGSLVAYLASRIIGTEVELIDSNRERSSIAEALGLSFLHSDAITNDYDILINASASQEALANALDHASFEAVIVEASWYGTAPVTVPLGGAFHSKRLSLISSQVGAVPTDRRSRWSFSRRLSKAMDLLVDARLDALISGETPFASIAEDYPAILANHSTLCHRIRY
ncbi:zinc-dependent alcohol dehydrogenase [Cohaesibacter marisflavi]|uniref:zinc-dependent alcohol dehydrogenase n=1 Tax=Cohaesibacter marisflavi TaxID=655353 RepID=UPI0029C60512|nr:zinc-binding alcohol dehydrogenase [Cohaesibacter marisflavi]